MRLFLFLNKNCWLALLNLYLNLDHLVENELDVFKIECNSSGNLHDKLIQTRANTLKSSIQSLQSKINYHSLLIGTNLL